MGQEVVERRSSVPILEVGAGAPGRDVCLSGDVVGI